MCGAARRVLREKKNFLNSWTLSQKVFCRFDDFHPEAQTPEEIRINKCSTEALGVFSVYALSARKKNGQSSLRKRDRSISRSLHERDDCYMISRLINNNQFKIVKFLYSAIFWYFIPLYRFIHCELMIWVNF